MGKLGKYVVVYRDEDGKEYEMKEFDGNEALSIMYLLYMIRPEIDAWQNEHGKNINVNEIFVVWKERD